MSNIVQEYIKAFDVKKEDAFFLESAYNSVKQHIDSDDKFIATNDVLRRRFKSTSILLVAIEKGYDILVPHSSMGVLTKNNVARIQEKLGIETDVKVHAMGNPQHLYGLSKKILVDEMPYSKSKDFQKVALFIKGGYVDQKCYKELVKEGLV